MDPKEEIIRQKDEAVSTPRAENETCLPEVRPLVLKHVADSRVFETATTRVIQELRERPIDPFYSASWPVLAHQVVGQEQFQTRAQPRESAK